MTKKVFIVNPPCVKTILNLSVGRDSPIKNKSRRRLSTLASLVV